MAKTEPDPGEYECPNCGETGPSVPVWPSIEAFVDPDEEPALVGCVECGEMERYLDGSVDHD